MKTRQEKRNIVKNLAFLFFLMSLSITILFSANSLFVQKFKEFGLTIVEPATGVTFDFKSKRELELELKKVKLENIKLKSELYRLDYIAHENKRLKKLYSIADSLPYNYVYAKVSGKDVDNLKSGIIIRAGSKAGVSINDPVIAHDGLVGIVSSVGLNSSSVKLINASGTKLPVITSQEKIPGIIEPISYYKGNLREITRTRKVSIDEELFTSSYSNIYPENILVGYISYFSDATATIHKNIKIRYACDFEKLKEVFVIVSDSTKAEVQE